MHEAAHAASPEFLGAVNTVALERHASGAGFPGAESASGETVCRPAVPAWHTAFWSGE
jgi:hypothetical protein